MTEPLVSASATARLVAALANPEMKFSGAQVAYLMGLAARWAREAVEEEPSPLTYAAGFEAGYRARVAEENAAYPPPRMDVVTTAGQDAVRVHRLREAVDVHCPRAEDYRGGPVPVWE